MSTIKTFCTRAAYTDSSSSKNMIATSGESKLGMGHYFTIILNLFVCFFFFWFFFFFFFGLFVCCLFVVWAGGGGRELFVCFCIFCRPNEAPGRR